MRVMLIGGTSHVGKSTLAAELASRLGWQSLSTDGLARHPGRPWGDAVPDDVRAYFLSRSTEQLVDEVFAHYRTNVWPIAQAIIHTRVANPFDSCIVMEGSAILPEMVAGAGIGETQAIWLTAPAQLITQRMHETSGYADGTPGDRHLIDRFLDRSLGFNERLLEHLEATGGRCIDVGGDDTGEALLGDLMNMVGGH